MEMIMNCNINVLRLGLSKIESIHLFGATDCIVGRSDDNVEILDLCLDIFSIQSKELLTKNIKIGTFHGTNINMFKHLLDIAHLQSNDLIKLLDNCLKNHYYDFARHLIYDLKIKPTLNPIYSNSTLDLDCLELLLDANQCGLIDIPEYLLVKMFIDFCAEQKYDYVQLFINTKVLNNEALKQGLRYVNPDQKSMFLEKIDL
jgi:hypothetical protein